MGLLADDSSKTTVLQVNDYNIEFDIATQKLEDILNRKLNGIVLVDQKILAKNQNKKIQGDRFKQVICDYSNPVSIIEALKPYLDSLLVVNASSERNQPYYKKLIPHLSYIKTPTESSITWATHKDQMRNLLHTYSADISPSTFKIDESSYKTELQQFRNSKFPLISKPVGLAASILVKRADNYEQLLNNVEESFREIHEIYKRYRGRGEPSLLIEQFMDGDMYSVDAYIDSDGNSWVLPPVKVTTAASIGLEGYYSYNLDTNHGLDQHDISKLNDVAVKSMHALCLKNSAAHIELFNTRDGWKIIELGPRAGGYRQDMYSRAYDIDHALNELLIKIGKKPIINTKQINSCEAFNIYADKEGVIRSINGFEEAKSLNGIHRLTCFAKPGNMSIFCGNGGNFIVDGVVYGKNKSETSELVSKIRDLIKIEVD